MNVLSQIKKKMKKALAPVCAAGFAVVATATSSSAAIVWTDVQADIDTAVADIVAGGLILLGAYAGFWGIKKVKALFAGG